MQENHSAELLKLEHMGILAGESKRIGLVEKIDSILPEKTSGNVKISHGEAVLAMILQENLDTVTPVTISETNLIATLEAIC